MRKCLKYLGYQGIAAMQINFQKWPIWDEILTFWGYSGLFWGASLDFFNTALRCPRICPFWSILTLVRESMWEWYKRRVVLERLLWDGCGGHSEPKTAKKRVFLPYWRQKIGFKFFPSYIWCKMGLFYDPWSLKKIGPKESPKMA